VTLQSVQNILLPKIAIITYDEILQLSSMSTVKEEMKAVDSHGLFVLQPRNAFLFSSSSFFPVQKFPN
jgi:hypothetical protein